MAETRQSARFGARDAIRATFVLVSAAAMVSLAVGLVLVVPLIIGHHFIGQGMHRLALQALGGGFDRLFFARLLVGLLVAAGLLGLLTAGAARAFRLRFSNDTARSRRAARRAVALLVVAAAAVLLARWHPPFGNPWGMRSAALAGVLVLALLWVKINPTGLVRNRAVKIACAGILLVAAAISALGFFLPRWERRHRPSGPNVIIAVIDCLRADHVGCYGSARATTPNIDQIAARGALFTRAYANASWTKPSVASLFTSLYPYEHSADKSANILPSRMLTLAEVMRNLGYYTYLVNTGNVVLHLPYNYHQGFDSYIAPDFRTVEFVIGRGDEYTARFLQRIARAPGQPFFAYLHYMDAHLPFHAYGDGRLFTDRSDDRFKPGEILPSTMTRLTKEGSLTPADREYFTALYDGQIHFVDQAIGRLYAFLDARGLLSNTIVFITADHGEELWDHGGFAHGHTVYGELLHVPLIAAGAGVRPGRLDTPAELIDIMPTVLEAAGVDPRSFNLRGTSLLPELRGGSPAAERPFRVFASTALSDDQKYSLMEGNDKIILNYRAGTNLDAGSAELYDVGRDPAELQDLAPIDPGRTARLRKELRAMLPERLPTPETAVVDPKLQEQLRTLGYAN